MQEKKSIFKHPELGEITVIRKPRAKRITLRVRGGCITATLPYICPIRLLEEIIDNNCERLKEEVADTRLRIIDWDFTLKGPCFYLKLQQSNNEDIQITGKDGVYILSCPASANFSNSDTQEQLRDAIKAALRHRAKLIIPKRLAQLATQHNIKYSNVSVRDSHSRWGSCSTRGSISLSIYLVLLPIELIDYVLRHELCHTVHMDHSPQFWALLDKFCGTSSKELRKQLKSYHTGF